MDVTKKHAVLFVHDIVAIYIFKLRVTRFHRGDGLCRQTVQILIRLDDALETIAIERAERLTNLHYQRVDILQCTNSGKVGQEIL